jgi:hypothetical protein
VEGFDDDNFKLLGVAAILSTVIATPVFAQAAIDEPGAFAFSYPNADVLNGGRPTPAATTGAMASAGRGSYASVPAKRISAKHCARAHKM